MKTTPAWVSKMVAMAVGQSGQQTVDANAGHKRCTADTKVNTKQTVDSGRSFVHGQEGFAYTMDHTRHTQTQKQSDYGPQIAISRPINHLGSLDQSERKLESKHIHNLIH